MAVQVKLSGVKQLSNTSLTSIVEFTNFNVNLIASAVQDFLRSINYVEGQDEVSVEIASIDSDVVQIKQKLSVLGTQLNGSGTYDEVIRLEPSGSVISKNVLANDVLQGLRVRLKVFGQVPPIGVPGEIIYVQEQPGYEEGFYGYLASMGWVCLSCGDGAGGPGGTCCCNKENIIYTNAGNTTGDESFITDDLSLGLVPALGTGFMFFVNGMQIEVGDGTKNAPVYLSDDNGVNALNFYQASPNSKFYWNSSIGGFDLDTTDRITMRYIAIDPTCGTGTTTTTTTLAPISTTTTTAGLSTTTTTVFVTSTTIPCAADTIVHIVDPSNPNTRVTFTGTPVGPYQVQFTDAYGTVHFVTALGNIIMPWVFDLSNPYYSSIPTINGVYQFTDVATGCVYTKYVGVSPTTTSTTTSTTTTSTTTTSTTTLGTTTTTSTTTTTLAPDPTTTSTSTSTTSTTSGIVNSLQIRVSTDFVFGSPLSANLWYAFSPTYVPTQPYPAELNWTQLGTTFSANLCNSYTVAADILNPQTGQYYFAVRTPNNSEIYNTTGVDSVNACAGGNHAYVHAYSYDSIGTPAGSYAHFRIINNATLPLSTTTTTTTTSTSTTSTTAAPPNPTTTSTLATTTTSTTQLGPQGLCCEVTVTPEDAQLSEFNTVIFTYRDVNNVIQQAYIQNSTQLPSTTYYCVKQAVSLEILTAADPIPVNTSTFVVTSTVCNNDTVCLPDNELTTTTTLGTTTSTTINDTTTTTTTTTALPCDDFIVTITDDGVGMQQYTVAVTGQPGIPVTVSYRSSSNIVNYGTGFTNFSQSFNLAYDMDLIVTVGDCTFTYSYDYDALDWIRVFPYDSTCHEVTVTDEDLQASAYGLVIFGYKDINRRPQTSSISQAGSYTYCIQSVNYLKVYNGSSLDPVTSSTVVNTQQVCTSEDGCLATTTTSTTTSTTTTSTTTTSTTTLGTTTTTAEPTTTTTTAADPVYSTSHIVLPYSANDTCPCEVNADFYVDTGAMGLFGTNQLCQAVLIKSTVFAAVAPGSTLRVGYGNTPTSDRVYRYVLTDGTEIGQFISTCEPCDCGDTIPCTTSCEYYQVEALSSDTSPGSTAGTVSFHYINCDGAYQMLTLPVGQTFNLCVCTGIQNNLIAPWGGTYSLSLLGDCPDPTTTTSTTTSTTTTSTTTTSTTTLGTTTTTAAPTTTTTTEPCECTSYVITNLQNASDYTISYTDCNTGAVSTSRPGDFGIGSFSELQSITICSQSQPTFEFPATVTPNGDCCGASQPVTVVYLPTTTTTTTAPTTTTTFAMTTTTTASSVTCDETNCFQITIQVGVEPGVLQYVDCTGKFSQVNLNPEEQYTFCYCDEGGWGMAVGEASIVIDPEPCQLDTTTTIDG